MTDSQSDPLIATINHTWVREVESNVVLLTLFEVGQEKPCKELAPSRQYDAMNMILLPWKITEQINDSNIYTYIGMYISLHGGQVTNQEGRRSRAYHQESPALGQRTRQSPDIARNLSHFWTCSMRLLLSQRRREESYKTIERESIPSDNIVTHSLLVSSDDEDFYSLSPFLEVSFLLPGVVSFLPHSSQSSLFRLSFSFFLLLNTHIQQIHTSLPSLLSSPDTLLQQLQQLQKLQQLQQLQQQLQQRPIQHCNNCLLD